MTRVDLPGVTPRTPRNAFRFEGREVPFAPGETVAAALAAAGLHAGRETRSGAARGPFCGMGACHDCLVLAEGAAQRACLLPAREGLDVARHRPRAPRDPARPAAAASDLRAEIVVVGAGPAGLAAAEAAAREGADVLLLDERKSAGGQYFKQPAPEFALNPARLDAQFREGRARLAACEAAGVRRLAEAAVVAPDGENALLVTTPEGARRVAWKRLVLATGAVERAAPFPGWTLPGVMTTGAMQGFLRGAGVAAGSRVVIAGAGPLNLQLAAELVRAGVTVLAVAEASAPPGPRRAAALGAMLAGAPGLVIDGARHLARLRLAGVALLHRHVASRAEAGEGGRVARVALAPLGPDNRPDRSRERVWEADALCVGHGFNPAVELAAALGCELRVNARFRHLELVRNEDGLTSRPGVFAAGDGAGFGGARAALASGALAGLAAAASRRGGAENGLSAPGLARRTRERRALARARRFQAALWTLYDAPPFFSELATPETLLCRCEELSFAEFERARATSGAARPNASVSGAEALVVPSLGALKRATRLGMGRCQGRYCAPVAAALLAEAEGREPGADDAFAPRTPLRPVAIGALAALAEREDGAAAS